MNVQRLSTEDGPGIRTTVFFKGCPLQCSWCHNPECISRYFQNQWFAVRCIGCNTCIQACPNGCLTRTDDGVHIDRDRCQVCGTCAEACPSGAMEVLGKNITVDDLLAELLKDRAYYEKSGGGVTLSGGEPTFQPDFAEALLRGLKTQGIATAMDTCGLASQHTLERLLPLTDLVLFDIKLMDDSAHRKYTGSSNQRILENLLYIRDAIRSLAPHGGLWIRTPLIPGITNTKENLHAIGRYLAEYLDGTVTRWELCAFNNLCRDQYARLGIEWAFANTPLLTAEDLAACEQLAKSASRLPEIVLATGATRALITV